MAPNFKIAIQRHSDSLQLDLKGDFDGSSALELVNMLKACSGSGAKIVINTENLCTIYPFGLNVFQNNGASRKLYGKMAFTGKYRNTIPLL